MRLRFQTSLGLRTSGDGPPWWPQITAYPFGNSTLVADANLDGTVDVNAVDACCYWFMWDGIGTLLQRGLTGDEDANVYSSPALADVGWTYGSGGAVPRGPGPPPVNSDLMPDLVVGSQYVVEQAQQVWAFSTVCSFPSLPGGKGQPVDGYPKGTAAPWHFDSSPALFDLNGDGLHETLIGCEDSTVLWYVTDYEEPYEAQVYQRPHTPFYPQLWVVQGITWYSSPALADLDGGGLDFVVGGDDGYLYAYHLNRANPTQIWGTSQNPGVRLSADDEAAISSSPVIADWSFPDLVDT
jgi:hypothetical protein